MIGRLTHQDTYNHEGTMNETPILIAGMMFGDEGKGNAVASFAWHARKKNSNSFVVRYNGGAQALHNVINQNGVHHGHAQVTSNMMVAGASGLISSFVYFNPWNYTTESQKFFRATGIVPRMYIDAHAPVITPYHVIANRIASEIVGGGATCGQGIGEIAKDIQDKIRGDGMEPMLAKELYAEDPAKLTDGLEAWQSYKLAQVLARFGDEVYTTTSLQELMAYLTDKRHPQIAADFLTVKAHLPELCFEDDILADMLADPDTMVIFEGAQGVLLDEFVGFTPWTTWSDTTFNNADKLLEEAAYDIPPLRVGVFRTYTTRHGSGPLPGENFTLKTDPHNPTTFYQGNFRTAPFCTPLARYAMRVCPIDALFVTHTDVHDNKFYETPTINGQTDWPSSTAKPVTFTDRTRAARDPHFEKQLLDHSRDMTALLEKVSTTSIASDLPPGQPNWSAAQSVAKRVGLRLAGYAKSHSFTDSLVISSH